MVCPTLGSDAYLGPTTDCIMEETGEATYIDDGWLEAYAIAEFRVWQILLLGGTILTTIVTFLCCCIRFRIPRTKQEIESDWERREMAREFERRMKRVVRPDEGSKLDLRKALERVHADVVREEEEKKERDVSIRIRDEQKDPKAHWRANPMDYGVNNSLLGNNAEVKGVATSPGLGWKTTTMIARVFYDRTTARREN
ncbi:uncharacterized protein LOC124171694 [Ischnura elegans]|uniref:uncharacterized protein LOC124171694 n=1 Tax=Ischnura elegans TaxID=197161 RepID=UPI001ED8A32A|nr:uncharacterized protein LOC124171694 [Ischnura elegans]